MAVKTKGKSGGGKAKEYDERNRGVLFVNDKEDNDKRPDYTGKLLLDPSQFEEDKDGNLFIRLAGWLNNSDKVGDYISLNASPPQKKD